MSDLDQIGLIEERHLQLHQAGALDIPNDIMISQSNGLKATYRRLMSEADPERKGEWGKI
jgi:hypothetical protein